MRWLVSYELRAAYRTARGLSTNEPMTVVRMIDQHPAVFVAENRQEMAALEDAEYEPTRGPQRVDEVVHIISAIEVPDGILTDEQAVWFD